MLDIFLFIEIPTSTNITTRRKAADDDDKLMHSLVGGVGGGLFSGMYRGGSRTPATSKMERFVVIINGF